jgi:hypothetical protein
MEVWVMRNFKSELDNALVAFGSSFIWNLIDGPSKDLSEPIKIIEIYENN